MTTAGKAPAARYEISIDGVPRSYRDRREIAVEAAGRLMTKYPHSVYLGAFLLRGVRRRRIGARRWLAAHLDFLWWSRSWSRPITASRVT